MAKTSRHKKRKANQAAVARARRHPNSEAAQTGNDYTKWVSSLFVPTQQKIIDHLFDEDGSLKVGSAREQERDFKSIQHIAFTEKFDKDGGPDVRYQIEIRPGSELFKSIVEQIGDSHQKEIDCEEIDGIKLLIGGTRDQPLHLDLSFKQGTTNKAKKKISEDSNSLLISMDLQYKCKLNVDISGGEGWEKIEKEFVTAGGTVSKHKEDEEKVRVLEAPAIIFDGYTKHSGAPCLAGTNDDVHHNFSGPIDALKALSKKSAIYYQDLGEVERLNSISRLFITTWPKMYTRRSLFINETEVSHHRVIGKACTIDE